MIDLGSALERYVGIRQGFGYKYTQPRQRLLGFVTFMERQGAGVITTKLALAWATSPPGRHPSWSIRLSDVRGFARYVAQIDPRTEVPPIDLLPPYRRAKPYIYSDAEIGALLAAASQLPPVGGLRRWTDHCFFGLIAVTGLRHSEALHLHRHDVDLDNGMLTVRETKFGKFRLVPLHATTVNTLVSYTERRDAHLRSQDSDYFFLAERGGRLLYQYVHRVFWRLSRQIGIRRLGERNGPRIQDLRHCSGGPLIPAIRRDRPCFLGNRANVGASLAE
jgi:integrase